MRPGGAAGVKAIKKSNGDIVTSPQEIAEELEKYWKTVFRKKDIMQKQMKDFPPQRSIFAWCISGASGGD